MCQIESTILVRWVFVVVVFFFGVLCVLLLLFVNLIQIKSFLRKGASMEKMETVGKFTQLFLD